jgi:hypothetical protein
MAKNKKPAQRYHIDGRVAIGLDALNDAQRKEVGEVIRDRDHFVARVADRHKVETISKKMSLYALTVPSGLNVIFRDPGGDIEILDLMGTGTLRNYGANKKAGRKNTPKSAGKVKGSA